MHKLFQDQLADICPDPIIAIDRAGRIVLFNHAAESLLEYSASEVEGQMNIADFYHPSDAGRQVKKLMYCDECGQRGRVQGHESALKTQSGRIVPIQISAALIEEDGEEVGSIGFFHDLSARKQLEESLRQLSITDNLTGLFNQRHFHAILTQEMARSSRYSHPLALICIDMDNFKRVNDTLGHLQGDNLIAYLGELVRAELRTSDFGFRYGGDEFMLILPETAQEDATAVAERLREAFVCKAPGILSDPPDSMPLLTLSIGIVLFNAGERAEQLIREADMAMYQAKGNGGNQVILVDPAQASPRTPSKTE